MSLVNLHRADPARQEVKQQNSIEHLGSSQNIITCSDSRYTAQQTQKLDRLAMDTQQAKEKNIYLLYVVSSPMVEA